MQPLSAILLVLGTVLSQLSCASEIKDEVYRGYNAKPGQFPYQALLSIREKDGNDYTCGGSLISSKYVLTAAHCTNNAVVTTVRLGVTNVKDRVGTQRFRVPKSQTYVHPNYNPSTLRNDISILALPSAAQMTDRVQTILLPKKAWSDPSTFDNYQVILTGYGGVVDNDTVTPHGTLQYTTIHKMPQADCIAEWKKRGGGITRGNICTDKTVYSGPCPGDSGGPLIVVLNSVKYEIGLVSYGVENPDCSARSSEVFTNVAYFLSWINSITSIPIS